MPIVSGVLQRKCDKCRKKKSMLQRAAVSPAPETVPPIVHEVLRSAGQPLGASTRAFMEPRFGHDFSRVRVHTDANSARSAREVNALAYTVGDDIVFDHGRYDPETTEGKSLLTHELTHSLQQKNMNWSPGDRLRIGPEGTALEHEAENEASRLGGQPGKPLTAVNQYMLQRSNGSSAGGGSAGTASAPTTQYGAACSRGAANPCQYSRCTGHDAIRGDIRRSIEHVTTSISALNATPLASNTSMALDWYFNDHSAGTASEVRRRLGCILGCLNDTLANNRYGCHPDDENLAYVCMGAAGICSHVRTEICFTDNHARSSDRMRGATVTHECAHRVGMSLRRSNLPDIYDHSTRFLYLDTNEALANCDSFALFAAAVHSGIRPTFLLVPSFGAGAAFPMGGGSTWQARLYLGTEIQHPVLGIFNPTLGMGLSLIGETATSGALQPVPSMLVSLLPGFRIGEPRPGASGGGYVSFFGGPAVAIGNRSNVGVGAEAGMALGFRWRWLDISGNVGYVYDPTREAHMEHLLTLGASMTFAMPTGR